MTPKIIWLFTLTTPLLRGFTLKITKTQQGQLAIVEVAFQTRGVAEKTFRGIAANKSAWDCPKDNFRNRYSIVQWDCRSFRSCRINNSIVGSPTYTFGIGPQYNLYFWSAGGERLLKSPYHHRSLRASGSSLLGSLFSLHVFGLPEHRFWGRWTASGSLQGC